ncbi:MAG: cytochrome c3 family protein [Terriglobales bacterium]
MKPPVPPTAAEVKCETCHDQIGSTPAGGTRHAAVDMGCDSCHVAHDPANSIDKAVPKHLKKTAPALCAECHDVQQKAAKSKSPHTALDNCLDCHDPHASANSRMLKQAQPALCETCHAQQAESHQKDKFLHLPAFQTGCSTCHEPHGSDEVAHLRAPINELCLSCHESRARGEPGSDEKTLLLFGGAVRLPGNYLSGVTRVALNADSSKGHPTAAHPVRTSGKVAATGKPMVCTTCHDPHASAASPQLFVTHKKSKSQLCIRCHT